MHICFPFHGGENIICQMLNTPHQCCHGRPLPPSHATHRAFHWWQTISSYPFISICASVCPCIIYSQHTHVYIRTHEKRTRVIGMVAYVPIKILNTVIAMPNALIRKCLYKIHVIHTNMHGNHLILSLKLMTYSSRQRKIVNRHRKRLEAVCVVEATQNKCI